MKKVFFRAAALMLMLSLLFTSIPTALAGTAFVNSMPKDESGKEVPVKIARGHEEVVLLTKVSSTVSGQIKLTVLDMTKQTTVKEETRTVSNGNTVKWKIAFDNAIPGDKQLTHHYLMRVEMDGKKEEYSLYLTYDEKDDIITVENCVWYKDNTACVFGLTLRDMKNPITDKWYTVAPIDLSIQGQQEFMYIASNIYIIGKITVTVDGDDVVVEYHNFYQDAGGNTSTLSEYMNIYHNLGEVKSVDPENIGSGFLFGQHISIQNDLQGDTNVLLFVLNHVTYCDYVLGYKKLTHYWPNLDENKAARKAMEQLMLQDDDTALTAAPEQGV